MSDRKKNHKLKVTITHNGKAVENVLCDVYLPKRLTDPIELQFMPTSDQIIPDSLFKFSIYGEFVGFSGKVETVIEATEVYCTKRSRARWGSDIVEPLMIGEPRDLKVTHIDPDETKVVKTTGEFWLTPSIIFPHIKSRTLSHTGAISVEKIEDFTFTLDSGLSLNFDDRYKYIDKGDDMLCYTELVAEFETDSSIDIDTTIHERMSSF